MTRAHCYPTDRKLLLARPLVPDVARVKENCFSLSFIAARSCQTWRRASTGNFCQASGDVRQAQGRWRAVAALAGGNCAAAKPARPWPTREKPAARQSPPAGLPKGGSRSEERRVGKECRSRWSP